MRNLVMVGLFTGMFICSIQNTYSQVDEVRVAEFAKKFSKDYDMPLEEVTVILNKANYQQSIIDKMERPAEGSMTWERYRKIFITKDRIEAGVAFWDEHAETLASVSGETGIPEEIILAIIGVETFYGQRQGTYKVLDALYTLAFGYPKRSAYFTAELAKFIDLTRDEELDIYSLKGSYAGAMGYGQFMPTSYEAYAVSFDKDGSRNLFEVEDAIASVANYLMVHRWTPDGPVTKKVSELEDPQPVETGVKPRYSLRYLRDKGYIPNGNMSPDLNTALVELEMEQGKEYWFGFNNFYVITRYNHSALYAMAVYQLSEAVKERRQITN